MSVRDIGACEWSELICKPLGWVMVHSKLGIDGVIGWRAGKRETAEQAHKTFTPNRFRREEEVRNGWVVRREEPGDREAFAAAIDELTKGARDG